MELAGSAGADRSGRVVFAALVMALVGAVSAGWGLITWSGLGASSVTPIAIGGDNPEPSPPTACASFAATYGGGATWTQLKFDDWAGLHVTPQAQITVTSLGLVDGVAAISWTSSAPVSAVYVKAGRGGNLYYYGASGVLGDSGLRSPRDSISHVTFCLPVAPTPSPTVTPPAPTPTPPPTPTPRPTPTPTPERPTPERPTATPTPPPTPTAEATPTAAPTATPESTPTPLPTSPPEDPTPTPTPTPVVVAATPTPPPPPGVTPDPIVPEPTATPTPEQTPTPEATPEATPTPGEEAPTPEATSTPPPGPAGGTDGPPPAPTPEVLGETLPRTGPSAISVAAVVLGFTLLVAGAGLLALRHRLFPERA